MKIITITIFFIAFNNMIYSQNDSIKNKDFKQFYYENGNVSSEGYLKDGVPYGFWVSYYITGIKKSEGKWNNNKLDSIWIFFDEFGDTTEKVNYYLGTKNGYQYKYYKSEKNKNNIYSKELYINGKRNDNKYYYYDNGSIKKTIPYEENNRKGIGFEYDKNGRIITITRYKNNEILTQERINRYNDKNEKNGVWKEFYDNGIVKEEIKYLDGKLNGFHKLYEKSGKLKEAVKYENDEIIIDSDDFETDIEIKEEYDNNENLIFQGSYKKDIPIGIHRFYDDKGNVKKSITYDIEGNIVSEGIVKINGKREGKWINYYKNKTKKSEGKYKNGKRNGYWIFYYPNGKIQQKGSYLNEKLKGEWNWYYKTGELLKQEFYIYGQLDGESLEYNQLGGIISKGNYIQGYKEGEWIYRVGDEELKGKYINDFKDGIWESYYINTDILSFKGKYVQGITDGKHIYYHPNGKIKEEQYYSDGDKVKAWTKYDEYGNIIVVIQYREGEIYKINGVRIKDKNNN